MLKLEETSTTIQYNPIISLMQKPGQKRISLAPQGLSHKEKVRTEPKFAMQL